MTGVQTCALPIFFEGRMLANIVTRHGIKEQITQQLDELFADMKSDSQDTVKASNDKAKETESPKTTSTEKTPETNVSETSSSADSRYAATGIDHSSQWVVKEQSKMIDDSYFSDATFIGDSRLEGFRNQSGITEGDFLTSVGMNVSEIFTKQSIASPDGNITVFQAMYPERCRKIYFMLGTNELGNVWDDFTKSYRVMMSETKRLFPGATIYAIGVPYVEENKVTTGDYINNANVDKMNSIILNICSEGGYYFLDVNEVLSDGNHSLIAGASSDGVHMYADYCKAMLDYLKTHYVPEDIDTVFSTESQSETNTTTSNE